MADEWDRFPDAVPRGRTGSGWEQFDHYPDGDSPVRRAPLNIFDSFDAKPVAGPQQSPIVRPEDITPEDIEAARTGRRDTGGQLQVYSGPYAAAADRLERERAARSSDRHEGGYSTDADGSLVLHIGGRQFRPIDGQMVSGPPPISAAGRPNLGDVPLPPEVRDQLEAQRFWNAQSQPGAPRVPGPIDQSGSEVTFNPQPANMPPDWVPQAIRENIDVPSILEHPGEHALGIAQTAPLLMGMTGSPAGTFTQPAAKLAAPVFDAAKGFVTAAPKTTAAGVAGTAFAATAGAAGELASSSPVLQQLLEQRASLEQSRKDAENRREAQRPAGRAPNRLKDPQFSAADDEAKRYEAKLSAIDETIKDEKHRSSPEYQDELRQKLAATPTRERYAAAMKYVPIVTGGAALLLGMGLKGRAISNFNTEIADISSRWLDAVSKGNAAYNKGNRILAQKAASLAEGLKSQFDNLVAKGPGGTKEALEAGAALGIAGAFAPEEVDFARAVAGSPLWNSLKKTILDDWQGTLERLAMAGGIGAAVGHIGTFGVRPLMSRPQPSDYGPETDALSAALKKRALPLPNARRGAAPQQQLQGPANPQATPQAAPTSADTPQGQTPSGPPSQQGQAAPSSPPEVWQAPNGNLIKRGTSGKTWHDQDGGFSKPPPKGSKRISLLDDIDPLTRLTYFGGYG